MRSLLSGIAGIICMWLCSFCCMIGFITALAAVIGILEAMFFQTLNPTLIASVLGFVAASSVGFCSLGLAKFLLKDDPASIKSEHYELPRWLKPNTCRVGAFLAIVLFICGLAWHYYR